jgi:hypothetical protein
MAGAAGDLQTQRALQMAAANVQWCTSGSRLHQPAMSAPQQPQLIGAGKASQAKVGSQQPKRGSTGGGASASEPPSAKKRRGAASSVAASGVKSKVSGSVRGSAPGGGNGSVSGGIEVLGVNAGSGEGDVAVGLDKLLPLIMGLKEYSPGRELRWVVRWQQMCEFP